MPQPQGGIIPLSTPQVQADCSIVRGTPPPPSLAVVASGFDGPGSVGIGEEARRLAPLVLLHITHRLLSVMISTEMCLYMHGEVGFPASPDYARSSTVNRNRTVT